MPELAPLVDRALADALEDPPCGPNLEYDPAFLELEAAVRPAVALEFDESGGRQAVVDWQWVERRALTLLERSKDVRLAVVAARAWVRLRGLEGLAAGLGLVLGLLERHWACAHPQLDAEDDDDPTMRMNALAALTHHEGLLADLRACAPIWEAFEPVTLRDLELALAPGGEHAGKAGRRTPHEILRLARDAERHTPSLAHGADSAARICHDLQRLLIERVGPGRAPDLSPLAKLIDTVRLAFPVTVGAAPDDRPEAAPSTDVPAAAAPALAPFSPPAAAPARPTPAAPDRQTAAPPARAEPGWDDLIPEAFGAGRKPEPLDDPFAMPAPTAGSAPPEAETPSSARPGAGAPREREPVQLGVSAPRAARPGESFAARFVAYVEPLEARVRQLLADLDGERARPVLGLQPERMAAWRVGTPVTVRLSGQRVSITPAERSFEWSGAHNLVSFSVSVAPDAPAGPAELLFEAFIEAVPIASIPLTLDIGAAASADTQTVRAAAPRTAFASYASADGALVAMCLSALARWDPGLQVFMDCLDLTPNEDWQKELERVIGEVDAFMLFWSKHAMASRWVQWEWHRANALGRPGFIRPFPLDDPAIAPPPSELAHLHFRDRYLMARQAMLRLADEVRARQADA